jgi:eukaryotic-like serine/threonine-protein kinase
MGEVYRARDTKLNREVALKILPPEFAIDQDRLARFKREAHLLASLNHPNIAAIYGLEDSSDTHALVLELIEGPTLADRLTKGRVPIAEASVIARQLLDALEAAHDHGIIHRDLKPANIKLRPDGTVKVLDFGLAKAYDGAGAGPAGTASESRAMLTQSPTRLRQGYEAGDSPAMTRLGMILGTAAYMSPEQAKGQTVDKRSDIWAFGCVLYEMLTGKRPFDGSDVSDTLAAVLRADPDWKALPAETPASLLRLLHRCLQKDRKRRLADVADARFELDDINREPDAGVTAAKPSHRREYMWAIAALVFLAVAVGAVARNALTKNEPPQTIRFDIAPPDGVTISNIAPAISPDGRAVAFTGTSGRTSLLWLRWLDGAAAQPVAGTEDASRPFWSPDSRYIGFFAEGKLKKVAVAGGAPERICELPSNGTFNGTWNAADVILFSPNTTGASSLLQVSSNGGQPKPATTLDKTQGEVRQSYPIFLPDGRHFFYVSFSAGRQVAENAVPSPGALASEGVAYIGSLDSNDRQRLPDIQSEIRYASSGHLLFLRDGALMAQPFDIGHLKLSGDAFPVAEEIGSGPAGSFSVSTTGTIVFKATGFSRSSQLVWFDRSGMRGPSVGSVGDYRNPELSPDGRFVAFERGTTTTSHVWVMELRNGLANRLTTDQASDRFPIWSPDGSAIVFLSDRSGVRKLYRRSYGLVGQDVPLKIDAPDPPWGWSRLGNYLAFGSHNDIWAAPMNDESRAIRVTETPFNERDAQVSPDGRWIAYDSNESGSRPEIYVQSFPQSGVKHIVSNGGGAYPRWSRDEKELFYVAPDATLMAVAIKLGGTSPEIDEPKPLFNAAGLPYGGDIPGQPVRAQYDVWSDGRFLMNVGGGIDQRPIAVILNWANGLQKSATR